MSWRVAASRAAAMLLLGAVLIGCSGKQVKPAMPAATPTSAAPSATPAAPSAGGLYAPHIQDGGPPIPADVSNLAEPVPIAEPLARYGNRSPYNVLGQTYRVLDTAAGYHERGIASWYGTKFHGRPTSSFEPYDMYKFTAAHKSLPLPTYVRVTNLENGRSLIVRVNDRGPFHDDRIIDLSYAAAVRLGVHIKGTARVEVTAVGPSAHGARRSTTATVEPARPNTVLPSGRQWLQIGSFGDRSNARAVEQRLSKAGFRQHRSVKVDVAGRNVWRVQVGPFTKQGDVDDTQAELRNLGFGSSQRVFD